MLLGMMLSLVLGVVLGWVWRSFQFARDRDCADPDHTTNVEARDGNR